MKTISRFVAPLMLLLAAGSGIAHASPIPRDDGGVVNVLSIHHREARVSHADRMLSGCGFLDEGRCQPARANGNMDGAHDMSLLDTMQTLSGVTQQ